MDAVEGGPVLLREAAGDVVDGVDLLRRGQPLADAGLVGGDGEGPPCPVQPGDRLEGARDGLEVLGAGDVSAGVHVERAIPVQDDRGAAQRAGLTAE